MTNRIIGYARTSTLDQTYGLETQIDTLKAMGCHTIFEEQLSSVDQQRPKLQEALAFAREGDTLIVTKLDRLARSMADLVKIRDQLEDRQITLKVLSLDLDTSTPTGKLMMNLLGSVAEFERDIMLERQREGIARAKAEGKYKGRVPTAQRKADDVLRLKGEGLKADQIAKELDISRASVFRILKDARGL